MVTVTVAEETKQALVTEGYAKVEFELSKVHLWMVWMTLTLYS